MSEFIRGGVSNLLRNGKRGIGSDKGGKGGLENIKFSVTYRLTVPQEHRQL